MIVHDAGSGMSIKRVALAGWVAAALGTSITGPAALAAPPAEIHIPGTHVVPESLTSSRDGTIYIGSIVARTIYRVAPGKDEAVPWILSGTGGMQAILGVFADDKSHTLWACSNTIGAGPPPAGVMPSLYAFDLKTGHLKAHYALPTPGGLCNDIATGADSTVYATDSNNMQVVRLRPHATQLEVWTPSGSLGPKGGTVDGISVLGKVVYVNTLNTNKIFSIPIGADGSASSVTDVKLSRPIVMPDGMRSFGRKSVLICERPAGGRISVISFSGDSGTVKTLKEGTYPDDPVSITVIGKTGFVLEGQFKTMQPNYTPQPFHATALAVGNP
jgi:hypothetical protein